MKTLITHRVPNRKDLLTLDDRGDNSFIVAHMNGSAGSEDVEISCVHTSYPHGLISWGWDGESKIILPDSLSRDLEDITLAKRKKLHKRLFKLAEGFAEVLNKQFPKGIR